MTKPGLGKLLACLTILALGLSAAAAEKADRVNVAVFNFQMKSDTPDWQWLEKGLADRVITDFFQEKTISVIQRDAMQQLAEQMNWVPEMMEDSRRLDQIRKALKPDYLISGVYEITGGELKIAASVIKFELKEEVARREVSGPSAEALELTRKLSASLLSWLTKRPEEKILEELPAWTRSIPATKALYEGMDLYDQGRYCEAWLKFRQSRGSERDNVEAQYWVAQMYHFMGRREHARLDMEAFLRHHQAHPRILDALWGYMESVEAGGASLAERIRLCREIQARYESLYRREGWPKAKERSQELRHRLAGLLYSSGQHKQAALLTGPAVHSDRIRKPLSALSLTAHHALTGETFAPGEMAREPQYNYPGITWRFEEGRETIRMKVGARILGKDYQEVDRRAALADPGTSKTLFLMAPNGYIFRSLRLDPDVTGGDDGVVEVCLGRTDNTELFFDSKSVPLADARRNGVAWTSLPSSGLLRVKWTIRVRDKQTSPPLMVNSVRLTLKQSKLPEHGAVYVTCPQTPNFVAEVDGLHGRTRPGLIGPLAPGEHKLTLKPAHPQAPYVPWTTTFTITPNQTTRVVGQLLFQPGSGWSAWQIALPQPRKREGEMGAWPAVRDMLFDNDKVRVVWNMYQDVWTSSSRNGTNFSAPRRIPSPVSSPWPETSPHCIRLESGRYLLTFWSKRRGDGRGCLYGSWSRDFEHWSAPARLGLPPGQSPLHDVCQDARGRIILANAIGGPARVRLYFSYDGLKYSPLGTLKMPEPGAVTRVILLERPDKSFEMLMLETLDIPRNYKHYSKVLRSTSSDGATWSRPSELCEVDLCSFISAAQCRGLTSLAVSTRKALALTGDLFFIMEQGDGTFFRSSNHEGIVNGPTTLAYHPNWGWFLGWILPPGHEWLPHDPQGPFVMRGAGPAGLMGSNPTLLAGAEAPAKPVVRQQPAPGAQHQPPSSAGQLRLLRVDPRRAEPRFGGMVANRESDFSKPVPGSGANPSAVVATLRGIGRVIKVAIDSRQAGATHPDLLRVDLTGKGDFKNAYLVPLGHRFNYLGKVAYDFVDKNWTVTVDGKDLPVNCYGLYLWSENSQHFHIQFGWMAQGRCPIGQRQYKVRVLDSNSNLRLGDPAVPEIHGGRAVGYTMGDRIEVDMGDGRFRDYAIFCQGQLAGIDGQLYRLELSEDLASLNAVPYQGPSGAVQVDQAHWSASLISADEIIVIRGNRKPIPVPPGRYVLRYFRQYADEPFQGRRSTFGLAPPAADDLIETITVQAGQTVQIKIGMPITATLSVQKRDGSVRFNVVQRDVGGRQLGAMTIWGRSGSIGPEELTVEILEDGGKSVDKMAMRFRGSPQPLTWQPPAGLRGRFKAVLRYRDKAFGTIEIGQPPTFTLP